MQSIPAHTLPRAQRYPMVKRPVRNRSAPRTIHLPSTPSNVYVITGEHLRPSGATDIPTILRRVSGLDVMQVIGADFNVSARGDKQLFANKILVMVTGPSLYIDGQVNQVYTDIQYQFRNVSVRGWWQGNGISVESVTHRLIEYFATLAPSLPAPINPTVDSYTLLNLRVGYRFRHDKPEFAVAVYHALDDPHKKHPLVDTLGSR